MIREFELSPRTGDRLKQEPRRQPSPGCAHIDRRRETRYATNDPAEIQLLEAGGAPQMKGKVLDVSRSGFRLEISTPMSKGLRLKIVLRDRTVIFGETRYCRHVSPSYHVGVAIESVSYAQPTFTVHIGDTELNLYVLGKGLTAAAAIQIKTHLFSCGTCQGRLAKAQTLQRSSSEQSESKEI